MGDHPVVGKFGVVLLHMPSFAIVAAAVNVKVAGGVCAVRVKTVPDVLWCRVADVGGAAMG